MLTPASHRYAQVQALNLAVHTQGKIVALIERELIEMIGVFVRFEFEKDLDEQELRAIAAGARARFEGMPGLRSKTFTFDARKREAVNFYVWHSEAAARNFYSDQVLEKITSIYGVRPSIEFVEIAALVDNGA